MLNKKINIGNHIPQKILNISANKGNHSKFQHNVQQGVALISPPLIKSFAFALKDSIFNCFNHVDIINQNHVSLANFDDIVVNVDVEKVKDNKNSSLYRMIFNRIYNNFSIIENKGNYHVRYIPTHFSTGTLQDYFVSKDFDIDNESEDIINLFWQHYNYYELNIISFLIDSWGFDELVKVNDDGKIQSFSADEWFKLDDENVLNSHHIKKVFDKNNVELDIKEIQSLFEETFISLNPYLLNKVLKLNKENNNNIYIQLQQLSPDTIQLYMIMQELIMQLYVFINKLNTGTTIYEEDNPIFSVSDLIVDFYQTLGLYPNMIKILENKIAKMHKDVSSLYNNRFQNLLRLESITFN